jgi:hypothetical protein
MGRDRDWKDMAGQSGLVGASCTHLGGDETVSWIIEVDKCGRGKTDKAKANGNDMYLPPLAHPVVIREGGLVNLYYLYKGTNSRVVGLAFGVSVFVLWQNPCM